MHISCHGGMGSPLSAHWRWIQIYQRTLSSIYNVIWMSMVDFGRTETGVLCPRKCLPCSLYVVLSFCVSGVGLVLFLLLLCNACMVSYQSLNHPPLQSSNLLLLAGLSKGSEPSRAKVADPPIEQVDYSTSNALPNWSCSHY